LGAGVVNDTLSTERLIRETMSKLTRFSALITAPIVIACALTVYVILRDVAPPMPLLAWVFLQAVLSVVRYISIRLIPGSENSKPLSWLRCTTFFLQGVLWAVPFLFFVPEGNVAVYAILSVVVIGVACGAMLTLLGEPTGALLVATPALAGMQIALLSAGDTKLSIMAILSLLFFSMVAIAAMRLRQYFIENKRYQLSLQEKNSEITDKNARLYRLAHFDVLTGAANRSLLVQHGNAYLEAAGKTKKSSAFLHIDLDHFKHLNDTKGHAAGDELLRVVSARLRAAVRLEDVVARLGGDEFGILAKGLDDPHDAEIIAEKIIASLERPQKIMGSILHCRASIGIAYAPRHGNTISELMNNSDLALQQAKRLGRGKYRVCSDDLQAEAIRKLSVEQELRAALRDKAICYHFQPIIDTKSGKVTGAEALMRIESSHPIHSSTEELLAVAETVGLMDQLGEQLFASLEEQGQKLFACVPSMQRISLNLSPAQLRAQTPIDQVESLLTRKIFTPEQLQIEITEQSVLERGSDKALNAIQRAFDLGISIVMDDFGTGYSSLTHLKMLPINGVKIDKSFVRELNSDMRDAAIVRSLVGMCKGLGLTVTAEGVENHAQLETLRRLGCDLVQGYLFFQARRVDELQYAIEEIGDRFAQGLAGIDLAAPSPESLTETTADNARKDETAQEILARLDRARAG
jgi:diguanylate cyclase (GGDEF)-like protein